MEHFVHRLLNRVSINQPDQLSLTNLSTLTRTSVKYWELNSLAVNFKGKQLIFINENLSKQQQWQEFAHELYHLLGHTGNQSRGMNPLFLGLQEYQASYFSYHFCVPTFMLDNLKGVDTNVIMQHFNVDYDFAVRRLEMYQSKVFRRIEHEMQNC